jgi:hypothetical protein
MRLTITAGAIAAFTFAATFVLYPYADMIGTQLDFKQFLTVPAKSEQPVAVAKEPDCRAPFGKVLAALAAQQCK